MNGRENAPEFFETDPAQSEAPHCDTNCGCRDKTASRQDGFLSPALLAPLRQPRKVWLLGMVAGLATGILAAAVMIALKKNGLSPIPAPLGVAFADTLLHRHLPLPVGIVFHLAYDTFWGATFVLWAHPRLTALRVALLSAALYVFALLVFVPLVGWGVFGVKIGPGIAGGLAITHALFGLFLLLSCRLLFRGHGHVNSNT